MLSHHLGASAPKRQNLPWILFVVFEAGFLLGYFLAVRAYHQSAEQWQGLVESANDQVQCALALRSKPWSVDRFLDGLPAFGASNAVVLIKADRGGLHATTEIDWATGTAHLISIER